MSKLGKVPDGTSRTEHKPHGKTLAEGGKTLMHHHNRIPRNPSSAGIFGIATGFESVKSPTTEKANPFEFTGTQIPKRDIHFDAERLVQRPRYRTKRHKFDLTKTECINEKNNDPMTMEDNFSLFDMPWISSLRFTSPQASLDGVTKGEGKKKDTTQGQPPSFYEKDMERWKTEKFKTAIEDRKQAKAILLKAKMDLNNLTTKNLNLREPDPETSSKSVFSPAKRRLSRQSNLNFSNVDFQYIGDTSSVAHLVNHRIGMSPNKVQLAYEMNLRTYQCDTTFKAPEPFMFPKTRTFKAVEADKSAFGGYFSTTLNSPTNSKKDMTAPLYNDQFKLRNMQSVRHSFLPGNMSLTALQEESNLRVIKPPLHKKKGGDDENEGETTTKNKK